MPPLMYWMCEDMVPKTTCTCPLSRSGTKPPRYGTWTRLIPVIILNRSPKTWDTDPLPDDPMLILPGDELRDRLGWNGWIDHHDIKGATNARDWRYFGDEIEIELL